MLKFVNSRGEYQGFVLIILYNFLHLKFFPIKKNRRSKEWMLVLESMNPRPTSFDKRWMATYFLRH